MNAPSFDPATLQSGDSAADLERLVQPIASLEAIVAGWDESHALTVQALKTAIEDLHKEALRRLIRSLKEDPAAFARMREALSDHVVYGVLRFHGLVKEPLQARVERALNEVRPLMHSHGGDIELVAVKPPDTVQIRLIGSCHGCPASSQTLTEGVEKAIRAHCPEIVHIDQVSRGRAGSACRTVYRPFTSSVRSLCMRNPAGWMRARSTRLRKAASPSARSKGARCC